VPVRGDGCWLEDAEGRRCLDFIGGIAVTCLGHAHAGLAEVLAEQARRVLHVSNLYWIAPQVELAERIVAASFADRVFFCNSGAEANEAAVKLARRHAFLRGDAGRIEVVTADGSFHGRTLAMLAATGNLKYREGFGPMPEGFRQVPWGDVGALEAAVGARTAAVLLEPLQGEGGVVTAPPGYLATARRLCDEAGALLVFDEVQVGVGRLGRAFAYQSEGVTPDVMTLAKGLGGGVPIGALACTEALAGVLAPGTHGTTFGGNFLACAAGSYVMQTVCNEAFLARVRAAAELLEVALRDVVAAVPWARGVRGRGLLRGIELEDGVEAMEIVTRAREQGLLVGQATSRVVRLAPPLVAGAAEIDTAARILKEIDR
jgi:predicted acetylornithine/succinylornithine family transaminase